MLFYLLVYTLATLGAFAVIIALGDAASATLDDRRLRRPLDACGRGSPSR